MDLIHMTVAAICIGWHWEAQAYLDPGTGSLVLQGLIAAMAAAFVFFRRHWYTLKRWLNRVFGRKG
jgi:hypothetical protein